MLFVSIKYKTNTTLNIIIGRYIYNISTRENGDEICYNKATFVGHLENPFGNRLLQAWPIKIDFFSKKLTGLVTNL